MFVIKCPECNSSHIVKNGMQNRKQRYLCNDCNRIFIYKRKISKLNVFKDWVFGKQTKKQLAEKYKKCEKTIDNYLKEVKESNFQIDLPSDMEIILAVDATYFNKKDGGIIVAIDEITGQVVYIKPIKQENKKTFQKMIDDLRRRNITIKACVSDGIKALRQVLSGIPHQLCQRHAMKRVRDILKRKTTDKAKKELLFINNQMTNCNSVQFRKMLDDWYEKYHHLLDEEILDKETLVFHKEKELNSAYNSLRCNLDLLFTFEQYDELPNTNNSMEGIFSHFKKYLKNHNGIRQKSREMFSYVYFSKFNAI